MGQALIRAIHSIDGATLHAAIASPGSPFVGKDAGEYPALVPTATQSPTIRLLRFYTQKRRRFHQAASSVTFAGLAAQARIVHVIGTTGCSR